MFRFDSRALLVLFLVSFGYHSELSAWIAVQAAGNLESEKSSSKVIEQEEVAFQIKGKVVREDGQSKGTMVKVTYWQQDAAAEDDLPQPTVLIPGVPQQVQGSEVFRQSIVVEDDGTYAIDVPERLAEEPETMIRVEIEHPGFLPRIIGPRKIDDFDFSIPTANMFWQRPFRHSFEKGTLRSGLLIRGQAVLPDGSPASGAEIDSTSRPEPYQWKFPNPDRYMATTTAIADEDGRFEILVDPMANLSIRKSGHAPLLIGRLDGFDDSNGFQLPDPIHPKGTLVDLMGKPVPFAIVYVWKNNLYDENSVPPAFTQTTVANENGQFDFSATPLPAGSYSFRTTHAVVDNLEARAIDPEDPLTWKDLETKPLGKLFLDSLQTFSGESAEPVIDWNECKTCEVELDLKIEDADRDFVRLTPHGMIDGQRWIGSAIDFTESGKVQIRIPENLEGTQINTGIAFLQKSETSEKKIGSSLELGKVERDLSGFVVTIPTFAKLKVEVEDSTFARLSAARIDLYYGEPDLAGIDAINNRQLNQSNWVIGSTLVTGVSKTFTCMPISNQKVLVLIRDQNDHILLTRQLELEAGEDKTVVLDLRLPDGG